LAEARTLGLKALLVQVRQCSLCQADLPLGPRPVLQVNAKARVLVVGQAPGRKVHETGVPFDDASGERLRLWMGVGRDVFYDETQTAILPMGFCYPGTGKSGDLPPRTECAPAWRTALLAHLPQVRLTLVIGQYALAYHLPGAASSVTEAVQNWQSYGPKVLVLPHPSPRNHIWLKRNPWFERDVVPELQKRVAMALQD
jgi:uracil-DNA glycosylase